MKKACACALALAVLLCVFALSEASFWTDYADLYYHACAFCGGNDDRVPLSRQAAQAFSKYTCPICCAGEPGSHTVDAVARGGTIVVRFSDEWIRSLELTSVFGWSSTTDYTGSRALRMLGEYLHDEKYSEFLSQYREMGRARGQAYMPHILSVDGALVMSRRHINNNWYVIVRPKVKFDKEWDMYWRVSSLDLNMQNDVLYTRFNLQTIEETRTLKLDSMNGNDPLCTRDTDALEIAVYRALDGNVAVIREKNAGNRKLENVQLRIGSNWAGLELYGYTEDESAVYCCMLTDGEVAALQENEGVELCHIEPVNSGFYRMAQPGYYSYHTLESDETLFSIAAEDGTDPVDDDFRLIMDGEPGCFAVQTDELDYIMDYAGNEYHPEIVYRRFPQRITPLVWYGESGLFLAEDCGGESFAVGEHLLANGIEFGREYAPGKNRGDGDYRCWLINDKGEAVGSRDCDAFAIMENGEIHMRNINGEIEVHGPYADD